MASTWRRQIHVFKTDHPCDARRTLRSFYIEADERKIADKGCKELHTLEACCTHRDGSTHAQRLPKCIPGEFSEGVHCQSEFTVSSRYAATLGPPILPPPTHCTTPRG